MKREANSSTSGRSCTISGAMPHLRSADAQGIHSFDCARECCRRKDAVAHQPELPWSDDWNSVSLAIESLFLEDRADRVEVAAGRLPGVLLCQRDNDRNRRLRGLLRASARDQQLSPSDSYRAAMIFQHGPTCASIKRARSLAVRAAKSGFEEARHLAAAALDRRLMYQGRKQHYGTQYRRRDGAWYLWPVIPSTTDRARRAWCVPSLDDALRLAADWNGAASEPNPTPSQD
jgi:hypothetical protein